MAVATDQISHGVDEGLGMKIRIADFTTELRRCASANRHNGPLWIGLAGSPGSGKSTLASRIKQDFADRACVIPMDGYHFHRTVLDQMDNPSTAHARRGAPFTFDSRRFVNDLLEAKRAGHGSFPEFRHSTKDPIENSVSFDAENTDVVLVEGNYVLLNTEPWDCLKEEVFDITCWLDVPIDECCDRIHRRNMDLGMTDTQSHDKIQNNDRLNAQLVSENGPIDADWVLR